MPQTPSDLVAGPNEAGVKTEWDASSLQGAIQWLETHASYLSGCTYKMVDIQDLMGGGAAAPPGGVGGPDEPAGGIRLGGPVD